jgi:hypothetical protein
LPPRLKTDSGLIENGRENMCGMPKISREPLG